MRATRLTILVFAVPIAAFIGLLVLVTALWVHPPTIGWIGLAVVALVSIAIGVAGYVLFPRMSVNADPVAAPERARLLVLADASAPVAELCDTVVLQLAGRERGAARRRAGPAAAVPLRGERRGGPPAQQPRSGSTDIVAGLRRRRASRPPDASAPTIRCRRSATHSPSSRPPRC